MLYMYLDGRFRSEGWAVPSPEGRHVAFTDRTMAVNAWVIDRGELALKTATSVNRAAVAVAHAACCASRYQCAGECVPQVLAAVADTRH